MKCGAGGLGWGGGRIISSDFTKRDREVKVYVSESRTVDEPEDRRGVYFVSEEQVQCARQWRPFPVSALIGASLTCNVVTAVPLLS